MPLLDSPFAQLDLIRQPEQHNDPLQAFDAADEYLLSYLAEQQPGAATRVLVLNDSFGALAASLEGQVQLTSSGDSFLAALGLEKNLVRNGKAFDAVTFVPASQVPVGPFDRVLIRVPKTLALLEEQLIRLQGQLAPGAEVVASAMIKHLPRAAGELLERYIGPMHASLAVKKARLLIATAEARPNAVSPYPTRYSLDTPSIELLEAHEREVAHLRERQRDHDEAYARGAQADRAGDRPGKRAHGDADAQVREAVADAEHARDSDAVGAQAQEQRMAQAHQAAVAEHQVECRGRDGEDEDARHDRHIERCVHLGGDEGKGCQCDQAQGQARGFEELVHVFTLMGKRPWGLMSWEIPAFCGSMAARSLAA